MDEGRGFTWTTGSPGVIVTARHAIEATEIGSRATMSIEYGGPLGGLVAWLTRRLNDRHLGLEAAGLKRRSEEGLHGRPVDRPADEPPPPPTPI